MVAEPMTAVQGGRSRVSRQARIVELITQRQVHSQSELLAMLETDGIGTTQATLSRDLDELGAVKLRGADGGTPVYVIPVDGSPVRGIEGGTAPWRSSSPLRLGSVPMRGMSHLLSEGAKRVTETPSESNALDRS